MSSLPVEATIYDQWTGAGGFGSAIAMEQHFLLAGNMLALPDGRVGLFDATNGSLIREFQRQQTNEEFGSSVAFVAGRVAIGAWAANEGTGAIYIFDQEEGDTPILTIQNPPSGTYGWTIAGCGEDLVAWDWLGQVYLIDINWYDLGYTVTALTKPAEASVDYFGASLAATPDYILVGDLYGGATGSGAAFLYDRDDLSAPVRSYVLEGTGSEMFGFSVAIDGTNIVIGAPGADQVFRATTESDTVNPGPANPGSPGDFFGGSVAIAGSTVVVGAPYANDWAGRAYAFDISPYDAELIPDETMEGGGEGSSRYGEHVAASGTYAAVAAPGDYFGGTLYRGTVTTYMLPGANTPPSPSIAGPSTGVRLHEIQFTGDPGDSDPVTLTWEVRDASDVVVATGSGATFIFTPQAAGQFTVTFTVTDSASQMGSASTALSVSAAGLDESGNLLIGGTSGTDAITVMPGAGGLSIYVNGQGQTLNPSGKIVIRTGDGLNVVFISSLITTDAIIFGGSGIDLLRGGRGNDIIVGGDGLDLLVGGAGRDILIGGDGIDRVVGDAGDDIIIAGDTSYDNDMVALQAIHDEWVGPNSYSVRVNNIRSGVGAGNYRFQADVTVFDDGAMDILTGNAGSDWFLFNRDIGVRDWVTDLSASEFADDLDFINAE